VPSLRAVCSCGLPIPSTSSLPSLAVYTAASAQTAGAPHW
jgi:hypothetical protein